MEHRYGLAQFPADIAWHAHNLARGVKAATVEDLDFGRFARCRSTAVDRDHRQWTGGLPTLFLRVVPSTFHQSRHNM